VIKAQRGEETETPAQTQTLKESIERQQVDQAVEQIAEKIKAKELAAIEAAKAEEAKQRLIDEATSPEVLGMLTPFLARRYVQPILSGAAIRPERTVNEQPMSLSRLEEIGALGDSVEGLKWLARVGTDRDLGQPRWSFGSEPCNWTPDNQRFLEQAQDMLRRYGPILVEERLLSP
jgi:hypothetical protein